MQQRLKTVTLVERAIAIQQVDHRQNHENAHRQGRFLGLEEARCARPPSAWFFFF